MEFGIKFRTLHISDVMVFNLIYYNTIFWGEKNELAKENGVRTNVQSLQF